MNNLNICNFCQKFIFSGFIAERMDLRYFLSIGMLFSGIFVFLLGFAKVAGIHHIAYFIGMQVRTYRVQFYKCMITLLFFY